MRQYEITNYEGVKNEITDAFFYWQDMYTRYSGRLAVLVLPSDMPVKMNVYALICMTKVLLKKRYKTLLVVSDSNDILQIAKKRYAEKAAYEITTLNRIDCLCKIEAAGKLFRHFYINRSTNMDDGDCFRLVGAYGLGWRDIIARVFFDLSDAPRDDDWDDASLETCIANEMNWKEYRHFCPFEACAKVRKEEKRIFSVPLLEGKGLIRENNSICLYGDTDLTLKCLEQLSEYEQVVVMDQNSEKWGGLRCGRKIIDPIAFLQEYSSNIRILITIINYKEVVEKLYSYGYELGKQVFIVSNAFSCLGIEQSELDDDFLFQLDTGRKIYENLRKRYLDDLYVMNAWVASGDIYPVGFYIQDYIKENEIKSFKVFVTSKAAKRVGKLIDMDCDLLTEEEALSLLTIGRIFGWKEVGILNANVNVYPGQRSYRLHGIVDFNTFYQREVFGLDKRVCSQKVFQMDASKLFETYHLIPGKTVLIAPYSNTLGNIPEAITKELVRDLIEKGYTVCTNVNGEEMEIEETVGIFIPYNLVLDFVNKAGGFIGIRSGLCDVISSTNAKMIVFYADQTYAGMSTMYYFGLQRMGVKTKDILEFAIGEQENDFIIEQANRMFE